MSHLSFAALSRCTSVRVLATFMMAMLISALTINGASANSKYAGIVIDANTGKTLYSSSADARRYPASLTKMMTLYMLFDAMKAGKVSKSTKIVFSKHAASMQPTKLGVPAGKSITAEQAILALVTKSANDAAAAVAEHLGGTESRFAEMMTRKARQLGMKNTTFKNASGLPNSAQVTTARDMARLGIALQEHFPREFKYFAARSFRFGKTNMANHNRLLGKIKGVDGIKTGYTRASGFNLVSSVNTDGKSIVAVVLGGRSGKSRNAQMTKLIHGYLPKASRRDNGPLIAKAPSAPVDVASLPVSELPIPSPSPRVEEVAAVAYAEPARPEPRPELPLDTMQTASTAPRKGWVIQIASLESEQQAIDFLRTAQDKAAPVVGNRQPFVEVFQKGSTTYHRARFAGFASKSEAWGACDKIKKYDYSCLAQEL